MVSGANKMSLMHWYRQITESKTALQKKLAASEQTNRILREEVNKLKELLYGIELEYAAKIHKK
jgi:cell division protein FtsB